MHSFVWRDLGWIGDVAGSELVLDLANICHYLTDGFT
jgi:hypothetical protein